MCRKRAAHSRNTIIDQARAATTMSTGQHTPSSCQQQLGGPWNHLLNDVRDNYCGLSPQDRHAACAVVLSLVSLSQPSAFALPHAALLHHSVGLIIVTGG